MAILQTVTLILTTNNSSYYDIHLKAHLLDALFICLEKSSIIQNRWYNKVYSCDKLSLIEFIFQPLSFKRNELRLSMRKKADLNSHVYVDTVNAFLNENRNIPKSSLLQTFLLDEQNNVILVGDPTSNPRIKKLFWRIVKEKLGEPKDSVGR